MKWRVVMLRKLAVFIVFAGLTMSPLLVQALGFGGIKLKSSLNEKLDADVTLLSASANDIQSLTIKLASQEAFIRAGIDRTALLHKLRFKIKKRANGSYYIHVTTTATVREPFMSFLLELDWKNGRMLREYTMLIDPPGFAPKFAAPTPEVAEIITVENEEKIEVDVAEDSTPFVEPVVEDVPLAEYEPIQEVADDVEVVVVPPTSLEVEPAVEIVDVEPEIEVVVSPETEVSEEETFSSAAEWPRIPLTAYVPSAEFAEESPSDEYASDGEMGDFDYGITQKSDNLWNIAEKLRQGDESVTVYQVMMALLQSNPDAFIDNNVHRLRVGHVLRIDDPTVLTSITRKEAAASFIQQTDSWNRYRKQVAKDAGIQPIMAGGGVLLRK